jgi:alginate O-acetyltransferase complex protein AlgI
MVFNSLEFALFLPIVLLLYHVSRHRLQNLILLAAGYFFYGFWDPRFLFLVSVSTVLDYATGLMIGEGRMSLRQRIAPSVHLVLATLLFLVLDLRAIGFGDGTFIALDRARLFAQAGFGLRVLLAVLLLLGLAHAAYPRLAALPEATRRRFFLGASLLGQLGMLAVFKYHDFFVASANVLAHRLGFDVSRLALHLVLPVGISFYTLQTLSYVLDVYWRRQAPVARLTDFALYVSYFPPLVAGPIERAHHLLPRLLGQRRVTLEQVGRGCWLILLGLFKKLAIADALALTVSSVYGGQVANPGALDVVVATVAFAFQIYGDFSGYSDIASGVSLLFGIELLRNFNLPYFAVNPSEFWRRWHISLSTWLRDYLYIPLGGNRGGLWRTCRNLMLTMLLGGLWHGAAFSYVLWGAYQGALLVAHRLWQGRRGEAAAPLSLLARLPRAALFFCFVCLGWLLFRAESLAQIGQFARALVSGPFHLALQATRPPLTALLGVPVLLLHDFTQLRAETAPAAPGPFLKPGLLLPILKGGVAAILIFLVLCGASNESREFIYFRF